MENTLENKARFFAQYYGQKVKSSYMPEQKAPTTIDGNTFHIFHLVINGILILKPISSISDEDSVFLRHKDSDDAIVYYDRWDANAFDTDYLRSKGYALPFNGLSVEQQVEFGWVRLATKSTSKKQNKLNN